MQQNKVDFRNRKTGTQLFNSGQAFPNEDKKKKSILVYTVLYLYAIILYF